jgi:hypothetical protein
VFYETRIKCVVLGPSVVLKNTMFLQNTMFLLPM